MSVKKISEAILGVGVDDTTIDLFESQYPVPTGVSYNSYVILDEKTAVLDTVDARATEPWLENLTEALATSLSIVDGHNEDDLVNFRRDGVQFNFQRFIITIALTGAVIAGVCYGTVG